jgi:hypothetical protein
VPEGRGGRVSVALDGSKLGEEKVSLEEAVAEQPTPPPEPQTVGWVVGSAEVLLGEDGA